MRRVGSSLKQPRKPDRSAQDVLDGLQDAVFVIEADGLLSCANRAAEKLTGQPRDGMVGRQASDVMYITDPDGGNLIEAAPLGRRIMAKGLPERDNFQLAREDGSHIPVSIRATYDKDGDGAVNRVTLVVRDVRTRRGMDMRTVELISTVSHEIRSPLTSVKGFTKTLLDRWELFDDAMKRDMLTMVNNDADRVTRLLNELLDISRLEAGRLRLRHTRFSIPELADRIVSKMSGRSENHELVVKFPKTFPKILADPDKVEQVMTNLIENALKYTDKGTVTVWGKKAGHVVWVHVQDQGEGIPANQISRLFRKFVRRERAGSPTGTGLGLYICKGLIEAHGGELLAKSEIGEGSTFSFFLPIEQPA